MRRSTTRKLLWTLIVALFLVVLGLLLNGCTKRDQAAAKKAGGVVTGLFGLPPAVGEGLVGLALVVSHSLTAKMSHSRGRKKERTCHVQKATA